MPRWSHQAMVAKSQGSRKLPQDNISQGSHRVAAADAVQVAHRRVVLARSWRLLLRQVGAALGLRGKGAALLRLGRIRKLRVVRAGAGRVVRRRQLCSSRLRPKTSRSRRLTLVEGARRLSGNAHIIIRVIRAWVTHLAQRAVSLAVRLALERRRSCYFYTCRILPLRIVRAWTRVEAIPGLTRPHPGFIVSRAVRRVGIAS